jgi:hypothetical protein
MRNFQTRETLVFLTLAEVDHFQSRLKVFDAFDGAFQCTINNPTFPENSEYYACEKNIRPIYGI